MALVEDEFRKNSNDSFAVKTGRLESKPTRKYVLMALVVFQALTSIGKYLVTAETAIMAQ